MKGEALVAINNASFMLTLLPLGVLVAAVAILALRRNALPVWLGWISALVAVALLVNGTFLDAEFGPAFLLFLLWMLLTSGVLVWLGRKAAANIPLVSKPAL